jgi:glucosylglycerate synthase
MASTGSSSSAAPEAVAASADVVVGLITDNDAETIGTVAAAVREGLDCCFEGLATRVALVDVGSADGPATKARPLVSGNGQVIELTPARTAADRLEVPYHGVPGKARALHMMLSAARDLNVRACVILDAAVRTVTPQWVEWLGRPVVDNGVDLVSPFFQRDPYEGALTRGIVYPVVRALYGVRLRQPLAAEFACSARLIDRVLEDDIWDRDGAQTGIDLWLATSAATADLQLAEAGLGIRTHRARGEHALDLASTITQIVGSLFADLEIRAEQWQRARRSVPLQQFGISVAPAPEPGSRIEPERLIESFRLGYRELRDIWTWVLPPRAIIDLRRLADATPAQFRLEDELWARIVYDFALAHRLRAMPRDHLLQSIVPLYLGWLASFILQVRDAAADAVDRRVEELATVFEGQKPYLIANWRWPERRRT